VCDYNILGPKFNTVGAATHPQTYGYCAESYPFVYYNRVFRRYNILSPLLNDDVATINRLESIAIDMIKLQALLDDTTTPNKFLRSIAKHIHSNHDLGVLKDPCHNWKSLARSHRNDDEQLMVYCGSFKTYTRR